MADQIFAANAGFFDAVNSDRTYSADDMNKPYSRVVANGVFATPQGTPSSDLQVLSAGSGMKITVSPGQGIFASKWFENQSSIIITVPNNNSLYPRVDSVIVQVDERTSGRVGNIVYRSGTPSSSAAAPAINTVANVTEYRVANIYVAAGANTINNDAITDLRGSGSCPWVTSLIQQVDTSTLWNQFNAAYTNQFNQYTQDFQEYTAEQRQAWEDFLSTLTEELTVTTNVLLFTSVYNASGTATVIPINIPAYNPDTDILQVFINGLLAVEGTDYTINADNENITLTTAIKAGNDVNFVVFKSVIGADIESAVSMIQRLDDKLSNFMADSGWITFTLEQGVQAYNSSSTPAVRCIGNRVYIRGAVKNCTATGTTICTLPVNFRPAMHHIFASSADGNNTVNNDVTITVSATDGTIKLAAKSGTISNTNRISIATSFLAATGNSTSMIFVYKGSVATYSNLPESPDVGDVYMIQTADPSNNIAAGDDVMYNGSEWELLQTVISSSDIDIIIDNLS